MRVWIGHSHSNWWTLKESDTRLTQDKRRCLSTKNHCIIAYFECDGALVSRRPLNLVIFSPKKYAKASWFYAVMIHSVLNSDTQLPPLPCGALP